MPGFAVPTVAKYQDILGTWGSSVVIAIDEMQDVPWEPFPFTAPWADYLSGNEPCGFRLVGDMVQLHGIAGRNAATTGAIGVLPSGWRPLVTTIVAGSMGEPNAYSRIDISSNGTVSCAVGQTLPANWASLDGISFSVT